MINDPVKVLKHNRSDGGEGERGVQTILVVHKTSASLKCVTFVQMQSGDVNSNRPSLPPYVLV